MANLDRVTVFRIGGDDYTREDLMKMEPVYLRALFRERLHHAIEVEIYPILLGRKKMPPNFGLQTELILDVWKARGLDEQVLKGKIVLGEFADVEKAELASEWARLKQEVME
jgi:hypothetical protein